MKKHLLISILLHLICIQLASSQVPQVANAIFGPNSIVRGVKNVIGGVLAMDTVHKQCMQKTLCSEFADEMVETLPEVDPVKRTLVFKTKVLRRRGKLRWIGDLLVNGIQKMARKIMPTSNRRQGGSTAGIIGPMMSYAASEFGKIPLEAIVHVMDFIVDATNVMERKGTVYPFVRASTLGYGYGHRRTTDLENGVCTQIAPDCGGWWSHLETANGYDGGAISRRVAADSTVQRDGASRVGQNWNAMEPKDILEPRVFLCKAGRFLQKINTQMGGEGGVPKDRFGNADFEESCDLRDLTRSSDVEELETNDINQGNNEVIETIEDDAVVIDSVNGVEIIEAKPAKENLTRQVEELPILVFEGLPEPGLDQSEEELVESILERSAQVPKSSVRTALRLPIKGTSGESLVIVEMDTLENEEKVLQKRADVRRIDPIMDHVGIRRAKYKELWKLVEELTIAKRVVIDQVDTQQETSTLADHDNL